jgi:hypothetical protein
VRVSIDTTVQSCEVINLVEAVTRVYEYAHHLACKGSGGEGSVKMSSAADEGDGGDKCSLARKEDTGVGNCAKIL